MKQTGKDREKKKTQRTDERASGLNHTEKPERCHADHTNMGNSWSYTKERWKNRT